MMPLLLVFATAFILSLALTPLAARLGLRLGLADQPGGRRRHAGKVARTGGIALFVSFIVAIFVTGNLGRPGPTEGKRPRVASADATRLLSKRITMRTA